MERVQAAGRCLILRKFSPAELAALLPRLSPRGLAVDTYLPGVDAANAWLEEVADWPF
jgi:hypothetical protein